jgi:hypothetical protein
VRPGKAARINVSAFFGVGMPAALVLALWPARLAFTGMWVGMLAAQLVCAATSGGLGPEPDGAGVENKKGEKTREIPRFERIRVLRVIF